MTRILVVEDSETLAFGLRAALEAEGYGVDVALDGVEALERLRRHAYDLVVLDLMLPRLSGFNVLRTLRAEGLDMPVLILSARGEEVDRVQGFRLGADNYAVKPIGVIELQARVESMLERVRRRAPAPGPDEPQLLSFGDVVVDARRRTVERGGRPVELSRREFDLLLFLLQRRGGVATRGELLREVWGYKREVSTRTVDTHIALLRGKLEAEPARPRHILTVRRVGYRLEP